MRLRAHLAAFLRRLADRLDPRPMSTSEALRLAPIYKAGINGYTAAFDCAYALWQQAIAKDQKEVA